MSYFAYQIECILVLGPRRIAYFRCRPTEPARGSKLWLTILLTCCYLVEFRTTLPFFESSTRHDFLAILCTNMRLRFARALYKRCVIGTNTLLPRSSLQGKVGHA